MPWRSLKDMTWVELEVEISHLRGAVERLVSALPATQVSDADWSQNGADAGKAEEKSVDELSLPDELRVEIQRRVETPPKAWTPVESTDEIAGTARNHVDDLALAERITFRGIYTGGHGALYGIFVDGELAGHSMRMSGPPTNADKRIYAARRLRQIGLVPPHGGYSHR